MLPLVSLHDNTKHFYRPWRLSSITYVPPGTDPSVYFFYLVAAQGLADRDLMTERSWMDG